MISIAVLFFLAAGVLAQQQTPIFSEDKSPTFNSIYHVDSVSNTSRDADFILRVNRNAPFNCTRDNCPASVIINNKTGAVNMVTPVKVNSLYVGDRQVIDSTGQWTGPGTGLIGPQGMKGDTGSIGAKGDTGATGTTGAKGDKGDTGATGATGATGPKGEKGDTGGAGAKGDKGDKGDIGAKGDTGANGIDGKNGDGCAINEEEGTIQCGSGPSMNVVGPQGPAGVVSRCFKIFSENTSIFGERYSAEVGCGTTSILTGGGCSTSNLVLDYFGPQTFDQNIWSCVGNRLNSSKPASLTAMAICCL